MEWSKVGILNSIGLPSNGKTLLQNLMKICYFSEKLLKGGETHTQQIASPYRTKKEMYIFHMNSYYFAYLTGLEFIFCRHKSTVGKLITLNHSVEIQMYYCKDDHIAVRNICPCTLLNIHHTGKCFK
jgi:hypothetical protein